MTVQKIGDETFYVGAEDPSLELFEGQYPLNYGVTYNSYLIDDEQICVMDSVDERCSEQWFKNIAEVILLRQVDYLVVSHLESDHSGSIKEFIEKYPAVKVVATAKAHSMMSQFGIEISKDNQISVKEGDTLQVGKHSLSFVPAPFVHWPEVMVAFDTQTKILYSADAFGTFEIPSTLVAKTPQEAAGWPDEARRYYVNIVGKYGQMTLNLLKKAGDIDYKMIAPLHGPVLAGQNHVYSKYYRQWATSEAEEKGTLIVYTSFHGNTKGAAITAAEMLTEKGIKNEIFDLCKCDMAQVVSLAFKYDSILIATPTCDGSVMPQINDFVFRLKSKNLCNRKVALIENGSWAPQSARLVTGLFEGVKDITFCQNTVTVKTKLTDENKKQIAALVQELAD